MTVQIRSPNPIDSSCGAHSTAQPTHSTQVQAGKRPKERRCAAYSDNCVMLKLPLPVKKAISKATNFAVMKREER